MRTVLLIKSKFEDEKTNNSALAEETIYSTVPGSQKAIGRFAYVIAWVRACVEAYVVVIIIVIL